MTTNDAADAGRRIEPFGSWESPISPDLLTRSTPDIGEVCVCGTDVWWAETRSDDGGRTTLVRWSKGADAAEEVLPPDYSVRSKVYEYGGSAWTANPASVYFVNDADQHVYRLDQDGAVTSAVHRDPTARYADFDVVSGEHSMLAVREVPGDDEPRHEIVVLDLETDADAVVLVSGPDFVWNPRLSSDGRWLAWVQWYHPLMAWEGAELWIASVADDWTITAPRRLAGGRFASVFQPEWGHGDTLYFLCESSGWWNVHAATNTADRWELDHRVPIEAEVGIYAPSGVMGIRRFCLLPDESIVFAYLDDGVDRLAMLRAGTSDIVELPSRLTLITQVRAVSGAVIVSGSTFVSGPEVVRLDGIDADAQSVREHILRPPPDFGMDADDLSIPESIRVSSRDGWSLHAFYYRPKNRHVCGPPGERCPMIVMSHGGPNDIAMGSLCLPIQYWTSRGFAVLDVDYRGSTGFGREHREALNGRWGELDVTDCLDATAAVVARGEIDGSRVAIRGGSAGGFTTLSALAMSDVYAAGVSRYGVTDLRLLALETHKFESHLLDGLIGPYPSAAQLYEDRSPVALADKIAAPVLLVQGLEDTIVPPNQAEKIIDAFNRTGTPYVYLPLANEGHGLRNGKNIRLALETELAFYATVLGFDLGEGIAPIVLEKERVLRSESEGGAIA